jgi:hypothetical protein
MIYVLISSIILIILFIKYKQTEKEEKERREKLSKEYREIYTNEMKSNFDPKDFSTYNPELKSKNEVFTGEKKYDPNKISGLFDDILK